MMVTPSDLNSIGQSVFELESENGNVDAVFKTARARCSAPGHFFSQMSSPAGHSL